MIVTLKQGLLKSRICESVLTGKKFFGFYGIPYAKPPVGELRFLEPKPHEGWEGILEATEPGNDCVHVDYMNESNQPQGKEDCLYLNVYTPQVDEVNHKPVMVFIHGGGFEIGSGKEDMFGPDYLLIYDIVLVTINYRLHALGFLNLGIPECPGNVGMKDQVLALKWVKSNIKRFGGDEGNITVFGMSAGAVSADLHMISPLSKGLFNRCILQGGSSLCSWSFTREPEKNAYMLGKELGYQGPPDAKKLLVFLKKVDANDIAKAVYKLYSSSNNDPLSLGFHFVPSVEKIKEGAFLPDEPEVLKIYYAEPLPVITGLTEKEILLFQLIRMDFKFGTADAKLKITPFVDRAMDNLKLNKKYLAVVVDEVTKFYFGNAITKEEINMKISDLFSDITIGISLYQSMKKILYSSSPVYIYLFTFLGALNFSKLVAPQMNLQYTSHADDFAYLFYSRLFNLDKELVKKEPEKTVIENLCKLFTNFARNGNPNGDNVDVKWLPSTVESPNYLQIDSDLIPKNGRIEDERMKFWDYILRKYRRQE